MLFKHWKEKLVRGEIEGKVGSMYSKHKGGYSMLQELITYIDLCRFSIKHGITGSLAENKVFLHISEHLIAILEDEN